MNEDPGHRREPTHAASASRVITRRLIALVAMMVLAHMAFTGGRVSLMLYAIKLQASTATVGLLVSLLSVVPMVLSVHMGRWTDRVGVFKPALIALTFIVAGTLLPANLREGDPCQFHYNTISDVVLQVRYTAPECGGLLRKDAVGNLKEQRGRNLLFHTPSVLDSPHAPPPRHRQCRRQTRQERCDGKEGYSV